VANSPFSGPSYAWDAIELMREWDDEEAIVTHDRRFTYAEVRAAVTRMAAALWHHGIRPGQTVGVFAYNPAESLFLQLGAHLFGARTAWAATTAPMQFRHDFLRLAGIDAFVYDTRGAANEPGGQLARVAAPLPILCFGRGAGPDLLTTPVGDGLPFDPTHVTVEPSTLVQTGGTTALPKLVLHGHRFYTTVRALSDYYRASGAPRLRHLLQSGSWHISSQTAAFMTLFSGGTLILDSGLDNARFLAMIERERVNSTLVAPPGLYKLLDNPILAGADTSSLQTLTVAGSASAPTRLAMAAEKLGPVVRIAYGMTESPMITVMPNVAPDPAHPQRLASAGQPFGDTRIEIRDATGAALPAGETGDIWVSSSLNMVEYFGQPQLTAQTLVDGFLRTGDIGRLDDDGYLYIVDREKDMIITGIGSTNVFCKPIEDVLLAHPQIRAAAVLGVPDPDFGERVHAEIVTAPGVTLTLDEVRAHVLTQLNERWTPTSADMIDELPLTTSGKVDKKALRERYVAAHAEPAGAPA